MPQPNEVEKALAARNIVLAAPPAPLASYAGFVKHDGLLVISGQLPLKDGKIAAAGRLGDDVSVAQGYEAAQLCAINLLSQLKVACEGDFSRVVRCLRLGGFVASTPDFFEQAKVVNGASDLIGDILGDKGRHARAAVGVAALPFGACVEVEGLFAVA